MSGAGSPTIVAGTAEVVVRANLGPLEQGLEQARRATQQFQTAANQASSTIQGGLNRSLTQSAQAASTFTNNTNQSAQAATAFNTSLARATVTARQFQVSVNQLNQVGASMAQSVQQFQAAMNQFTQGVNQFNTQTNNANRGSTTFRQNVTRAAGAIGLIPGPAGAAASRIASLLVTLEGLSFRGAVIGGTIGALGLALTKAYQEAEAFERASLRLTASLEATSYAAGLVTSDIEDFAEQLEATTLATSDEIKEAAQALITFGSVSGDEFKRTITLAQDLSSRFGGIVNATEALGRAFERPAEAARLFRRIGLHELVLQQAQAMQDAGKEAESYSFILDAISSKVKDFGTKEAEGAAGAFHRLDDAVGDLFRVLGQDLGIVNAVAASIEGFTFVIKGADIAVREFSEGIQHLQELFDDPFASSLPELPFAGKDTLAIFAKGQAEAALAKKKADDEALKSLKAQQEAAKKYKEEMEALAKAEKARLDQLEVQREAALESALIEVSITERLLPELLKSNLTRSQINKTLSDRIALEKQLSDLGLAETSVDAQRLISAKLIRDIDAALIDAVGAEDEFRKSQLNVNEALREFNVQIDEISQDTVLIGKPETLQATEQFRAQLREMIEELKRTGINTELLENNFDSLTKRFSDADALNRSTQLLNKMIEGIDALNRELDIQTTTFGMSVGAAEAYRFEQEALARQIELTGEVTAQQRADIHTLAQDYGEAAEALNEFRGRQEAARFASGTLSDALRRMSEDGASLGEALMGIAESLADVVTQAALFGEGPLAKLLGTDVSGGLFGGAINDLFGLGGDAAGAAAEGAGATAEATALTGAATALTTAGTGLGAAVSALAGPTATLVTAGAGLNTAAGALSAAAAAITAASAASGGADVASGIADAAGSVATVGSIHTGRDAFSARPSPSRRVPLSSFIKAPRFHTGLRQNEFAAILEDGEGVTSKEDMKKMRRGGRRGGDLHFHLPSVSNADQFMNSQGQIYARFQDEMRVSNRRNR